MTMDGQVAGYVRSSLCGPGGCVEVARQPDGSVLIRDSKQPDVVIRCGPQEWEAFIKGVKAGEFDESAFVEL